MAFTSNKTLAQTKYNRTKCANRKTNKSVDNLVIHYTGTQASARNNCLYFGSGNRSASADYFIDKDGACYKFNKYVNTGYSWHCGDGGGKYGITNARSIGFEVVSAGEAFTVKQIKKLKAAVRYFRKYYKKDIPVVRHYDASRKVCPAPYAGSAAKDQKWKDLLKQIDETYVAKSDCYTYSRRYWGKRYRKRSIKKGKEICIVSTFQGAKYLWGTTVEGDYINLTKSFKSKY